MVKASETMKTLQRWAEVAARQILHHAFALATWVTAPLARQHSRACRMAGALACLGFWQLLAIMRAACVPAVAFCEEWQG
jgi:hypothetical protein